MNNLVHAIQSLPVAPHYWLAYSGGLDSQVLLHLLANHLPRKHCLSTVHVHHGLSEEADQWAKHCETQSQHYAIPYQLLCISAQPPTGESPEAYAREQRYRALKKLLQADDVLLTAHHADDQAETVLLQLLRGAGVRGLAAMNQQVALLPKNPLIRPLLPFTRQILQQYAVAEGLNWVEDSSNADLHYDRNFIRHQVLPLLQQRWPAATQTINRAASHCRQAEEILLAVAQTDLKACQGKYPYTLAVSALKALTQARQCNVLRDWLRQSNLPLPDHRRLEAILEQMLNAPQDANPQVNWQTTVVRRYQGDLYALTQAAVQLPENKPIAWDLQQPLTLPANIGTLKASKQPGRGLYFDDLSAVTVRFRQQGEHCQLPGRTGKRCLKKLMQQWQIPPWERRRIPLIYYQEQLACIVGYALCEPFLARNGQEEGWECSLRRNNSPLVLSTR